MNDHDNGCLGCLVICVALSALVSGGLSTCRAGEGWFSTDLPKASLANEAARRNAPDSGQGTRNGGAGFFESCWILLELVMILFIMSSNVTWAVVQHTDASGKLAGTSRILLPTTQGGGCAGSLVILVLYLAFRFACVGFDTMNAFYRGLGRALDVVLTL